MDMREKLVELLVYAKDLPSLPKMADFLLARGVTVQEWIPVTEPPKVKGCYFVTVTDDMNLRQESLTGCHCQNAKGGVMMQIEELGFSVRTYNCLKRAKVDTVDQLSRMSDDDLLRIRCFGQKCLDEVRSKIALPRKTEADRIRAMSDEELAKLFQSGHIPCDYRTNEECRESYCGCCEVCTMDFLQQPAEEVHDNG